MHEIESGDGGGDEGSSGNGDADMEAATNANNRESNGSTYRIPRLSLRK